MIHMEQQKIPKFLYVTKLHENKVRVYRFISTSSNGKYLYEDAENGFKECFLYADIFSSLQGQKGYSNSSYKEQERNEKLRIKRRGGKAYERKFK